tara:strand:- start:1413 stop:3968 length:2556 start_codon:yes stop_codon:yes gene_type:complete
MFQFNQIPPNIQKTLFKRINALTREGQFKPLTPVSEQKSNATSEMLTKSCWVRVTSAVPQYKKHETGEFAGKYIYPLEKVGHNPMRLSSAFDGAQRGTPLNRPLTSKQNLLNNYAGATLRPHTGITAVQTSFKNHSIQNVTINWKLWDIDDFEVYEQAFLKHGRTIIVEFGWSTPEMVTLTKPETPEDMIQYYTAIQEKIISSGGNYYAAVGVVKGFNYAIGANGEFDCTTELTSMGNTLFKGPVDPGDNPIPEVVRNKNAKNAEEAFQKSQVNFESYLKKFNDVLKVEHEKGNNADVYYNKQDGKGYCTYGWFEDEVLNTFFGAITKKTETGTNEKGDYKKVTETTTHVRSIGTKYKIDVDSEGEPVSIEPFSDENKCRYSENLYTMNKHIQFPGRYIGISAIKEAGENADKGFESKIAKKYVSLGETFDVVNDFRPFVESGEDFGRIRRIVFSADFLTQQFSGVRSLQSGLENLFSTMNAQYGSFWDFRVVQDQGHNGRIGVIDQLVTEHRIKDVNPKMNGKKSTIDDPNHCFEFPLYSNRSLFKEFGLEVKLSSAMATQAMFHSNKNFGTQGEDESGKPEDIGVTALASLQNQTMTDKTANTQAQDNSKDFILDQIWYAYLGNPDNNTGPQRFTRKDPSDPNSELELTAISEELNLEGLDDAIESKKTAELQMKSEEDISKFESANNWFDEDNPSQKEDALIYTSEGEMLGSFERGMLWLMNKSADSKVLIDPITPISVSFTISGIGGISMYDMFAVDYLPKNYRDYGLFQVTGVDHSLSPAGWDTAITGLLRVDMDSVIKAAKKAGKYDDPEVAEINSKFENSSSLKVLQLKQNSQKFEKAKKSEDA